MFKVVVLDGKEKLPEDDIYYIIAKGGVFLRKKLGLIESITPVTEISILEDIQSYAKMSIPKIPGKSVAKVMTFFKKAYESFYDQLQDELRIRSLTDRRIPIICDCIQIDPRTRPTCEAAWQAWQKVSKP